MRPWLRVVRGCRKLVAHFAPQSCPVCLDELPLVGLLELPHAEASADGQAGASATFVRLRRCKHKFCSDCISQYMTMKIREKDVENDKFICPVVECKMQITERDVREVLGVSMLQQFQSIVKRKNDEKNPSARWCPRAGCDELIICDSNVNFTCPKCKAVGCFQCRGFAHRFWFCRAQVDPSYLAWEKSVGQWNAVRGCPRCRMRIWKSEGCNHMTCTHCRHQYCWVCGSNWEPSHYGCYEVAGAPITRLQQIVGYVFMLLIIMFLSVFGLQIFLGLYLGLWIILRMVPQRHLVQQPN